MLKPYSSLCRHAVTFKDFLHKFHLKSREYSTKIAFSPSCTITLAMTVGALDVLPTPDPSAVRNRYKKLGILGGSEVAAVYVVCVDSQMDDKSTSVVSRRLSGSNPREKLAKDHVYAMKAFQGTTPQAEYNIRKAILALRLLNHKNVVKIYDSFQEFGQIHIVTDLYVGGNLASRFPYSEHEASRIVAQILSGVRHLHEQDIVHAALSLETILFDSGRTDADVIIVNLGISRKFLCAEMFTTEAEDQSLYAASPESFRGWYTKKGDLWSIGVITYYLISGSKPFQGENWQETLQGVVQFKEDIWRSVSTEAKTFINALLSRDPNNRPDIAKAMSYRWVAWSTPALPKMVRSKVEEEVRAQTYLRGEEFNRVAMNVSHFPYIHQ